MMFLKKAFTTYLAEQAAKDGSKILAFADSNDISLQAASILKKKKIAIPVIVGDSTKLLASFKKLGLALTKDNISDPNLNKEQFDSFVKEYSASMKRDKKANAEDEAREILSKPVAYAMFLLEKDLVHGVIAGSIPESKPLRLAYERIGLAPGVGKASGLVILSDKASGRVLFFADVAFIPSPVPDELSEIAELSYKTAAGLGIVPKVAFLSFSTNGAAKHALVDNTRAAYEIFSAANPSITAYGEIQADCALDPDASKAKVPDSPLKGDANVLIFPDLNSGNISYKLLEKLTSFESLGPIFLGLNKPVADVSKAVTAEEIVSVAAVTALQANICKDYANAKTMKRVKPDAKKYHPMELIPTNVRKIIEEARSAAKKDKQKDD